MISIIVAIAENNAIGYKNELLCRIPSDLKRFKEKTSGKTVIMGRKTFESLPKLLPNRKHIVISKNAEFQNPDIIVENDISKLAEKYKDSEEEVFIIGGAEIYNYFLPYCKNFYLTRVYKNFEADKFFNPDFSEFKLIYTSEVLKENDIEFQYFDYTQDF